MGAGTEGQIESIEDDGAVWVVFTILDEDDSDDSEGEAETLMVPKDMIHMLERAGRPKPVPKLGLGVSVVMQAGPKSDDVLEEGDSVVVARRFSLEDCKWEVGQQGKIAAIEDDGTWWVDFVVEGDESDEDEVENMAVPPELTDNLRKT